MENEVEYRRGKSVYPDFVEEFCGRTGKNVSDIITKDCGDVSGLRGQSFDVVWIDEAVGLNGKSLGDFQITALTKGLVWFKFQPAQGNIKEALCSKRSGLEIQEVDIHQREGERER